ncbi:MAG: hypothetical protein ACOYI8_07785 [Christensenellales bacterium]|jgi:hypothetical protein
MSLRKMLSVFLVLMVLALGASAELSVSVPDAVFIELFEYEGGTEALYTMLDGEVTVEVLESEPTEFGKVGEVTFAELAELRTNGALSSEIEVVSEEPIDSYPALWLRYTEDSEDGSMTDNAVAIWTDEKTFAVFFIAETDSYADNLQAIEDAIANLTLVEEGNV